MNKCKYMFLFVLFFGGHCIQAVDQDAQRAGKEALNKFVDYTRGQKLDYMFSNKTMSTAWLQHALGLRMNGTPLTAENKNNVQEDLLKAVEGLCEHLVVNPSLSASDLTKIKRTVYNLARYQIIDFMLKQPLGTVPVQASRPISMQSAGPVQPVMTSVDQNAGLTSQIYDQKTQTIQESGVKQLIAQVKSQNPKFSNNEVAEAVYNQAISMISQAKNVPIKYIPIPTSNGLSAMINKLNNPFYKAPRSVVEDAPALNIYHVGSQIIEEDGLRRLIATVKKDNPQFNNEQLGQAAYKKAAQIIAQAKNLSTLDKPTADELLFSINFLIRTELAPTKSIKPAAKTPVKSTPIEPSFYLYNAGSLHLQQDGIRQLIDMVRNSNPQFNDEQLAQATYNKAAPMVAAVKKLSTLDKPTADELMWTIKFIIRTPNIRFT